MVAATGLVTSSGIVNATSLVSNSNLVNTANIVTNSSLAEQLNSVVQTGEKLNSLVHPGGGGGDLDREKLHTLIHTGDLDTVQLVHSYNLPPSAEKEQHTVVEQLLLQASGLQQVGRLFVGEKKTMFLKGRGLKSSSRNNHIIQEADFPRPSARLLQVHKKEKIQAFLSKLLIFAEIASLQTRR